LLTSNPPSKNPDEQTHAPLVVFGAELAGQHELDDTLLMVVEVFVKLVGQVQFNVKTPETTVIEGTKP